MSSEVRKEASGFWQGALFARGEALEIAASIPPTKQINGRVCPLVRARIDHDPLIPPRADIGILHVKAVVKTIGDNGGVQSFVKLRHPRLKET